MRLGVCDYCPALRLCIGSGGGVAFTFPTQGWATVTEESGEGRGWWWVSIFIHATPSSPFIGRGAHTGRSHVCFKRWRDRCLSTVSGPLSLTGFLSLTAPPTASSYITPSPSPGPLPLLAYFSLFQPKHVRPTDCCFPPNIADTSSVFPILIIPM